MSATRLIDRNLDNSSQTPRMFDIQTISCQLKKKRWALVSEHWPITDKSTAAQHGDARCVERQSTVVETLASLSRNVPHLVALHNKT